MTEHFVMRCPLCAQEIWDADMSPEGGVPWMANHWGSCEGLQKIGQVIAKAVNPDRPRPLEQDEVI